MIAKANKGSHQDLAGKPMGQLSWQLIPKDSVWSKATLITGNVCRAGLGKPTGKMGTFFKGHWCDTTWANFQQLPKNGNGILWKTFELEKKLIQALCTGLKKSFKYAS